ncbi:unnamed protein product [Diabrotica balteata]|uniref:Uncharacterized protein n=1 Tax=Diabrotica balteata TaxID=107213 RepID=A0A9N9XEE8_DIABA|nr:unnamed protein product [Diabrotica balteata]
MKSLTIPPPPPPVSSPTLDAVTALQLPPMFHHPAMPPPPGLLHILMSAEKCQELVWGTKLSQLESPTSDPGIMPSPTGLPLATSPPLAPLPLTPTWEMLQYLTFSSQKNHYDIIRVLRMVVCNEQFGLAHELCYRPIFNGPTCLSTNKSGKRTEKITCVTIAREKSSVQCTSPLSPKRERDAGRKWESGSAKRKRKAERAILNQSISTGMMKFLNPTVSGSTEPSESIASTSKKHSVTIDIPMNLGSIDDEHLNTDTERQSEIDTKTVSKESDSNDEIPVSREQYSRSQKKKLLSTK